MHIRKMYGLGNDFIIYDMTRQHKDISQKIMSADIAKISDRHFGIGCDQFIIIENGTGLAINDPLHLKIFNQDGSTAEACGNAMRCIARIFFENYPNVSIGFLKTKSHLMPVTKDESNNHYYAVNMGQAIRKWQDIPTQHDVSYQEWYDIIAAYDDTIAKKLYHAQAISMGNPHLVLFFDDIHDINIADIGHYLEHHDIFPQKANIEFVQQNPKQRHMLTMRVWERGAGITLACGSGACAVYAVATDYLKTQEQMIINLDGGDLTLWYDSNKNIWMQGSATDVGYITLASDYWQEN